VLSAMSDPGVNSITAFDWNALACGGHGAG
jgi:hypothetical protein